MAYKNILVEKKDGVAKIILNRPEAMNSVDLDTHAEIQDALADIDKDVNASATAALSFWAIETKDPRSLASLRNPNSIAYKSHRILNKSLHEIFQDTDLIPSYPQKVDQAFIEPFKGMGLKPDVEEELGRGVQAEYVKYRKTIDLSQSNTISLMANDFYKAHSDHLMPKINIYDKETEKSFKSECQNCSDYMIDVIKILHKLEKMDIRETDIKEALKEAENVREIIIDILHDVK